MIERKDLVDNTCADITIMQQCKLLDIPHSRVLPLYNVEYIA